MKLSNKYSVDFWDISPLDLQLSIYLVKTHDWEILKGRIASKSVMWNEFSAYFWEIWPFYAS